MPRLKKSLHDRALGGQRVFPSASQSFFAASYPEGALKLQHNLANHPLLQIDKLAMMAESMPEESIEYNRGDVPIAVNGKPEANGMTIGDTIRNIENSNSWAVLKNVEQKKPFAMLLDELLEELRPIIEARTGPLLTTQAYVFISSPNAVTPLHFDPEHNILMQLRGSKTMTVYRAGDPRYASDRRHEAYHTGGARELPWNKNLERGGLSYELEVGDALYVPVMAPHFVRNGPEYSVSLSITWRSEWSYAEADARAFNALLRKFGMNPKPPARWPGSNAGKAKAMRVARRLPGIA
ncbi:cupin-like domain-containing protein [Aurantiacibacter sp. D1-12]|uniref:cupin-like domain-containing protein n=1 Tax=Aurantiacibacter sp. D1-12 TaxID=2993658 RepID=UPI00237CF0F3|nr:cupin-like domain-containing protein [Aurantiacibacter sp. D1-12]MDE1466260.1 cupin-like domain-containing protein [Aurantiacibacter sp. D1-12]